MKNIRKVIISKRRWIQLITGILIMAMLYFFHISLWYILAVGVVTGLVFGKVFCRWMCPIGFVMELMMGADPEAKNLQMYNYHKLGCPIAWFGGLFNRFSLIKVKRAEERCTDCGVCDRACYIVSLNPEFSLFRKEKKNPAAQFSCSKCLVCVSECPTKSLDFKL